MRFSREFVKMIVNCNKDRLWGDLPFKRELLLKPFLKKCRYNNVNH